MNKLDAIVLCGGLGTRLSAVVNDRPKPLADVDGRPFVAFLLDQLQSHGIRRVWFATGHLGHMIEDAFGTSFGDLFLHYSRETEPLGTAGAIRLAFDQTRSDPLLVMNGDSFCDVDLGQFFEFHRRAESEASLVLAQVDDSDRYGGVSVEPGGRITDFSEKKTGAGLSWINAGIYLLSRRVIGEIPAGEYVSFEKQVLPHLIPDRLFGFETTGKFIDIGIPDDYRAAGPFFRNPKSHSHA